MRAKGENGGTHDVNDIIESVAFDLKSQLIKKPLSLLNSRY